MAAGAGGLELATRLGDTLGQRGRAREHALSLDIPEQAELFHRRLIDACIRANAQHELT